MTARFFSLTDLLHRHGIKTIAPIPRPVPAEQFPKTEGRASEPGASPADGAETTASLDAGGSESVGGGDLPPCPVCDSRNIEYRLSYAHCLDCQTNLFVGHGCFSPLTDRDSTGIRASEAAPPDPQPVAVVALTRDAEEEMRNWWRKRERRGM